MISSIVTVGTEVGLHARPATLIADTAANFHDDVYLTLLNQASEPAEASSSLMIMALGAEKGDQIRVESRDEQAVAAIAALISRDLDAACP